MRGLLFMHPAIKFLFFGVHLFRRTSAVWGVDPQRGNVPTTAWFDPSFYVVIEQTETLQHLFSSS
jgi:hypothetical protein